MYGNSAKKGADIKVMSEHGFTITNNTGKSQIYHIEFDNLIYFGGTWPSPNAHGEYDRTIENGETFEMRGIYFDKTTRIASKGSFQVEAKTVISYYRGAYITDCSSFNNVNIL